MNLIFCVFWCHLWLSSSASGNSVNQLGIKEVENESSFSRTRRMVKNKWFKQNLDHFNVNDNRTWKQRYVMNMKYFKTGGPVFLMVGGREEISKSWMISGAWIEYAQHLNAACFLLEHRFYGLSQPTDNLNTTNLAYLTIEQVLADLATFIETTSIEKRTLLANARWVGFGSSYSGNLVTWLRIKYPHLLYAAVSSSSPLMAKLDFEEYFKTVQRKLLIYKPQCEFNIRQANEIIFNQFKTAYGTQYIQHKFNTCHHFLSHNNTKNIQQLFKDMSLLIGLIVQYDEDDEQYSKTIKESEVSLKTLCDIMLNDKIGSTVDRYATVIKKFSSIYDSTSCLSTTYNYRVYYFSDLSSNSEAIKRGDRQWLYQSCTQFGFFQTSNRGNHLFSNTVPLEYFTDLCTDVFGKSFNSDTISKAVDRTNMMYGGQTPRTSRVVFVEGYDDPWSSLGLSLCPIFSNRVSMQGTSHCADIQPSYSSDPPQLTKARKNIETYLREYLTRSDFEYDVIPL